MRLVRITHQRYSDPLDSTGAKASGGRFNSKGTSVVYLATSQALALLEVRVHSAKPYPLKRLLSVVEVPDSEIVTMEDMSIALPDNWATKPVPISTQKLGDAWVKSQASLGLYVPSAVSDSDMNVILNPSHPSIASAKVVSQKVIAMDVRLWEQETSK